MYKKEITVVIKGTVENSVIALTAMLQQLSDDEIREAMSKLDSVRLIRVASAIHGRIYKRILGQRE